VAVGLTPCTRVDGEATHLTHAQLEIEHVREPCDAAAHGRRDEDETWPTTPTHADATARVSRTHKQQRARQMRNNNKRGSRRDASGALAWS
jgi:hypothetical protein